MPGVERRTDSTENVPMHISSIGFLPEGVHPLYRFLSLNNRQERPAASSTVCSKRVRSSGTAYRARTVSSDSLALSEAGRGRRNDRQWHVAAVVAPGQGGYASRRNCAAVIASATARRRGHRVVQGAGVQPRQVRGYSYSLLAAIGFQLRCG